MVGLAKMFGGISTRPTFQRKFAGFNLPLSPRERVRKSEPNDDVAAVRSEIGSGLACIIASRPSRVVKAATVNRAIPRVATERTVWDMPMRPRLVRAKSAPLVNTPEVATGMAAASAKHPPAVYEEKSDIAPTVVPCIPSGSFHLNLRVKSTQLDSRIWRLELPVDLLAAVIPVYIPDGNALPQGFLVADSFAQTLFFQNA